MGPRAVPGLVRRRALTEVADHAERHVAHAGRLAGLREVADVAGHGARARLGLVSHRPLGRAFATAAPLAAVLAGTFAAARLWWAVLLVTDPDFATFSVDGAEKAGPLVAAAALLLPATLMAGAVLTDRWPAARALALATIVVAPLLDVLSRPGLLGLSVDIANTLGLTRQESGLLVLNALILLIAPSGRTHPRSAAPWAVAVPIVAAVVITTLTDGFGQRIFLGGFDLVAPVATGAAIALTARTAVRAALATALLAAPPCSPLPSPTGAWSSRSRCWSGWSSSSPSAT